MALSADFVTAVAPLKEQLAELQTKVKGKPAPKDERTPTKEQVFGVPTIRKGENALTSRGYMFTKLLGHLVGLVPEEEGLAGVRL